MDLLFNRALIQDQNQLRGEWRKERTGRHGRSMVITKLSQVRNTIEAARPMNPPTPSHHNPKR
jgi:hypothetical protein